MGVQRRCLSLSNSFSSTLPSPISLLTFYFSPLCKSNQKILPSLEDATLLRPPPACLCRDRTCSGSLLPAPGAVLNQLPLAFQAHLSPVLPQPRWSTYWPSLPAIFLPVLSWTASLRCPLSPLLPIYFSSLSFRALFSSHLLQEALGSPACTEPPPSLNSGLDVPQSSLHII